MAQKKKSFLLLYFSEAVLSNAYLSKVVESILFLLSSIFTQVSVLSLHTECAVILVLWNYDLNVNVPVTPPAEALGRCFAPTCCCLSVPPLLLLVLLPLLLLGRRRRHLSIVLLPPLLLLFRLLPPASFLLPGLPLPLFGLPFLFKLCQTEGERQGGTDKDWKK